MVRNFQSQKKHASKAHAVPISDVCLSAHFRTVVTWQHVVWNSPSFPNRDYALLPDQRGYSLGSKSGDILKPEVALYVWLLPPNLAHMQQLSYYTAFLHYDLLQILLSYFRSRYLRSMIMKSYLTLWSRQHYFICRVLDRIKLKLEDHEE